MKKTIQLGLVAGALAICGSAIGADYDYTDIIQFTGNDQRVDSNNDVRGRFDLVNPGNSSYTITGYPGGTVSFADLGNYNLSDLSLVVASFFIKDDSSSDGIERVDINLGAGSLEGDDLSLVNGGRAVFAFNSSLGTIDALVELLEVNGQLSFRITRGSVGSENSSNDFLVEYAVLQANKASSVPDGGMILGLLGIGMLGVVGVNRRMRAGK